jgi:hypothetical protein
METSTRTPGDHLPSIGSNIVLPDFGLVKWHGFSRQVAQFIEVPPASPDYAQCAGTSQASQVVLGIS